MIIIAVMMAWIMNNLLIVIIWTGVRATVTVVIRVNTIINFRMEDPLTAQ